MINELKDLSFLELFILNTITYFDVFDYPLTLNEVYTYLYTGGMEGSNYSLEEISETLETSEKLNKIITTQGGFYFLKGREEIIQTRLDHYNLADKKFKIALRAIKLLKYCPGIKMIAAMRA